MTTENLPHNETLRDTIDLQITWTKVAYILFLFILS